MRVERIARDKVRIFVSYDDLEERGIDRDEIWQNGKKVQELFWDMMETAYVEVGFEIAGPIAVEAFTMPTEGVVVIVTRIPSIPGAPMGDDDDDEQQGDDFSESLDTPLLFSFDDFENVVSVAHVLHDYGLESSLYRFQQQYFLSIDDALITEMYQKVWAVLREYGDPTNVTSVYLKEYGVTVFAVDAVGHLVEHFPLY